MYYRTAAGIIVSLWLAVNLLGSLAAVDYDVHIVVSSALVSDSLDIPDDLKHPSLFPLAVYVIALSPIYDHSALRHRFLTMPLASGSAFKPHVLNCVFLI
jgi:hypothetical protein